MDEILIEEKKYVSSKRAAKMTGYAKDYIGQLCREGRVPARLIGRSWYVLEAAIQDHRFGNPEIEPVQKEEKEEKAVLTLESSHFEASTEELLPSLNRLKDTEQIQDSWKAWFDRFDHAEGADEGGVADTDKSGSAADAEPSEGTVDVIEPVIQEMIEEEQEETEEKPVPIHTVSRPLYRPPPEEFLPRNVIHLEVELPNEQPITRRKGNSRGVLRTMQVVGAILALAIATVAVIGSGYFDKYIILNSQVMMMAGVELYNK